MDRVNILPNQRVGLTDYEDGAGGKLVQEDQIREGRSLALPSGRTVGGAATSARILAGFGFEAIVFSTDDSATLNRGTAILPLLTDDSELLFGLIQADEGPAQRIIDFSTAAPSSTQAVYLRATNTLATFQNRVFWNPDTGPAEFIDNVATRRVATWEVTFQDVSASPPGSGEWVKIWEVVMDGATKIASINDYRHFYFEGDASATYTQEWGAGANDRDSDRTLSPVTDLHRLVQLLRRQLTDIIGGVLGSWATAIPRHLTDLAVQHLAGGNHGAVVANSVRLPESPGAGIGLSLDGAGFPIMAANGVLGSIRAPHQQTPSRRIVNFEAIGRIARPHRFYDDFMYSNWTNLAGLPPEPYTTLRVGTTEFRVGQLGAKETQGGVMAIETSAGVNDNGQLLGPPGWVLDSDVASHSFMARVALDLVAPTTRRDSFGLFNTTASSWWLRFLRDQATLGNANWWMEVWDGATFFRSDSGIASTANVFKNFYFCITGEDTLDYWITGMAAPLTLSLSPSSLSGLGQRTLPIMRTENNGTATAIESYLDYWEIWDDEALSLDYGQNG